MYAFTPKAMPGANSPKLKDQLSYGWNVAGEPASIRSRLNNQLNLSYLIEAFRLFPEKEKFFILPKSGDARASFFNKLAGNATLMEQLKAGTSEEAIRQSWAPALKSFKKIRAKYLIYK